MQSTAQLVCKRIDSIKGGKIVGATVVDNYGVEMPMLIVAMPDGREVSVSVQCDSEGNDSGWLEVWR